MFQPSTSRDPLLTRGGDSDSDGGESVEKHAYDDDPNAGGIVYFTDVKEDQSSTPISESTVVDGVDANILKLPREDQRFLFVEFSPDWSLVVTVTSDETFSVWDATNEWVLVGSKRLRHDGRILKCIAFDPYIEEAVLLCFDSGEIFRTNLRRPATSDGPGSSQEQGMNYVELVHKCDGRFESFFDHFTFSSDRKTMVYYNLDGEFVAIRFPQHSEPEWISLSKEFVLKQDPKIYVFKGSTLITAAMKSSEDRESTGERIETLVWSELDFRYTIYYGKPIRLEGKGYLSHDAKYAVISSLATKHQSTCCQLDMHLIEGLKSSTNVKRTPFTSKTLPFTSSHPHLEFLDRNQFNFLNLEHIKTEPLIAIRQTNSVGNRLLLWDTYSDALIYEVDLTLSKEARKSGEVQYCWSSDYKWLGACSVGVRMMGLVCARSGVFVWTAYVPQISRKDSGFCTLLFDRSGTRLMIYLDRVIYLLEPPCLSKKPQRHPIHHDFFLSQAFEEYVDFEILEMAKEWPKQVLFNILLARQGMEHKIWSFLVDATISLHSTRIAMVCQKNEGSCFLCIINYDETSSMESLWFMVLQRWNQLFLEHQVSLPVKEIRGDPRYNGVSVFYYYNEETNAEQIVVFSTHGGIKMQDLDSDLKELSEWTTFSDETCFSFKQSKDRRSVIALTEGHVIIVDLNKKMIVKSVEYSFGLSIWWESFMEGVKFFAYSHYDNATIQESNERHKLFIQDRLRGLFDVSDDGEMILIGWNIERNMSLVITPDKSEEQFRTEWDEARESLYQCSMLTENGKWLGFIDYAKLMGGGIVVRVVNTTCNLQQCIWLGPHELLINRSLESQHFMTKFFLRVEETKEELVALGLEEIGQRNKMKRFSIKIAHDVEDAPNKQTLLEDMTKLTDSDRYGKRNQPSTFNMQVAGISNLQRVLIEEGENKMKEVAKRALHNRVKVSNVYRFHKGKEHDDTTFLTYAQEKRETSLVQLCLRFIEDGLFTFHSASNMMKDSFFEMLFLYKELILPILKKNSLTFKATEVKVPAQIFQSQNALSNVVFTSDTMLEPNEYFVGMAIEDSHKTKSSGHFKWTKDLEEEKKELSCVSFHYITNACKVGLNGIIRKLLMLDLDSSFFKTELIRATITWKWDKLWKRRCLHELCLYIVFLTFFTSYAVRIGVSADKLLYSKKVRLESSFLLLGASVLAIVFFFGKCMQMKTYLNDGKEVFGTYKWGLKHYFLDSQWNLVDLSSYFSMLVLIPILHFMYIFEVGSKKALFVMVAIESILAWFKLWYFAQPFDRSGALVLLIRNVIQDCVPFLFLALIVLVGFSVALYVLFQCFLSIPSTNTMAEIEEDLIHESFGSPLRSLSTLFYAMVGTFEVEVYYNHQSLSWLTTLIFILYMTLEMIVMLNMLIAIMSDTFDRVKNEEDVQIITGRATFIDACEASLSDRQIRDIEKQIGKFLYVLKPKDRKYVPHQKNWKGQTKEIAENIKNAMEINKEEIEKNIERQFEQMKEFLKEQFEGR